MAEERRAQGKRGYPHPSPRSARAVGPLRTQTLTVARLLGRPREASGIQAGRLAFERQDADLVALVHKAAAVQAAAPGRAVSVASPLSLRAPARCGSSRC